MPGVLVDNSAAGNPRVLYDPATQKILASLRPASIVCDSIAASRTKCGFFDGPYPNGCYQYFLMRTETIAMSGSGSCGHSGEPPCPTGLGCNPCTSSGNGTDNIQTYTVNPDGTCAFHNTNFTIGSTCCGEPPECSDGGDGCFCCQGTFNCSEDTGDPAVSKTNTYCDRAGSDCCGAGICTLCQIRTTTDSNEYTTAMLIANTIAALPSYPGTFSGGCSASRDLAACEYSYSIQRFKPKFRISAPLGADLVICYNEHFVPDVGGPVDTPKTVTIPAGGTEIVGDEVIEPGEDGEITITDITSC